MESDAYEVENAQSLKWVSTPMTKVNVFTPDASALACRNLKAWTIEDAHMWTHTA
jgi:hypothetical protein